MKTNNSIPPPVILDIETYVPTIQSVGRSLRKSRRGNIDRSATRFVKNPPRDPYEPTTIAPLIIDVVYNATKRIKTIDEEILRSMRVPATIL